jgi:hypothetical protein
MDCPHCGKAFHDHWDLANINREEWKRGIDEGKSYWQSHYTPCPACKEPTIDISCSSTSFDSGSSHVSGSISHVELIRVRVYPRHTFRKPTPAEVPLGIKEDYEEACRVLADSQKASAALSRRCLQAILREHGYNQHNLWQQIDSVLAEPCPAKALPSALRDTVDAIRCFGNFSAHPITDQTTLQVIPVDEGEAEWCLEILEEMFDHYYVKPERAKVLKAQLDAKLEAAGKPKSK